MENKQLVPALNQANQAIQQQQSVQSGAFINKSPYECVDMSEASAFNQIRLAIVGKQKSGKSRLASTGRKPILFLDYDGRKEAVSGIPGVFAITLQDNLKAYTMPTATANVLDILTRLELGKLDLHCINPAIPEGTFVKTIVHDSATFLSQANLRYILYNNKSLAREVDLGPNLKLNMSKSWDGWMGDTNTTINILARTMALGVDTIMTFHEDFEEAPGSTSEKKQFTGKITIDPKRYIQMLGLFNEVWHMELVPSLEPGKMGIFVPQVRVMQAFDFNAATCLMLDPTEKPNIEEMIKKHELRKKGGK